MPDPQPSCSEIARKIAFESSAKHGYEEASLRGWQEEQITEALQAKQKEIEEKDALIIKGMKLANQEIAEKQATIESLIAEVERLTLLNRQEIVEKIAPFKATWEKEISHLKAEVDALKKALDHWTLMHIQESAKSAKLEAQLSRLKEILKGRDEALRELIKEVRDMAPVFIEHGMEDTGMACLFEAEAAEQALSKTWEEGENAV